jgi:hypothetical protein
MSRAHDEARVWLAQTPPAASMDSIEGQALRHLAAVLREWDARAVPVPTKANQSREHYFAQREGAEVEALLRYFQARPGTDSEHAQRLFAAGFQRGYDAAKGEAP